MPQQGASIYDVQGGEKEKIRAVVINLRSNMDMYGFVGIIKDFVDIANEVPQTIVVGA